MDGFGIASAFKIKYAFVAPTVFVITDELTVRIAGQSGFSRTRKAKENGGIAVFSDVGRAVHAEHAFLVGKNKIECGENTFLDFAGVSGTTDQHHFAGEIENGEIMLTSAVNGRVGFEAGRTDDGPVGVERGNLFIRGTKEQVVGKEVAPGQFGIHAHIQAVVRIGTHIAVAGIDMAIGKVSGYALMQPVESLGIKWDVDISPPYGFFGDVILYDEPVFGRTAGKLARIDGKSAVFG